MNLSDVVHDSGVTRVILDVLSVIVNIDYDLVPGALTRVLPVISMVSKSKSL